MDRIVSLSYSDTEFAPLVSLDSIDSVRPDFDLKWLPGCALARLANESVRWTSAKADIAGIIALGVAGAMAQGRMKITAQAGVEYDLNLYLIVSAKVGERKSSVYKSFQHMVSMLEEEQGRQIMVESATFRAMLDIFSENEESEFITSGDGGIVEMLVNVPDEKLDLFLKAYSGEPYRYSTKTAGSVYLSHPLASLLVLTQDKPVGRLLSARRLKERGFLSRCLIVYPNPVGRFPYEGVSMEQETFESAYNDLRGILCDPVAGDGVIRLSESAKELHRDFYYRLEDRKDELLALGDWNKRVMENLTKIVGILHVMKHGTKAPGIPVSDDMVKSGINIMEYFIAHSLYGVKGRNAVNPEIAEARFLLNNIAKMADENGSVNKRVLKQKFRTHFSKQGLGEKGLGILRENGYISSRIRKDNKAGRPVEEIILNPNYE